MSDVWRNRAVALVLAVVSSGCGYRPLRTGLAGRPRIRVERAVSHVVGGEGAAVGEHAATGARAELARFGALASSDDPSGEADALTVEVVRLDERSEGAAPGGDGRAHARGVRVRVVARGVVRGHGESFETTEVESSEAVATPDDTLGWEGLRAAAIRTAARRAGAGVAREVLGVP